MGDCEVVCTTPHYNKRTKFLHSLFSYELKRRPVKTFHNALFLGDSFWICGWTKNVFNLENIVFLDVDGDDHDIFSKSQFEYPGADQPMVMFAAGDKIFFARRDGHQIHSFNTMNHEFHRVFHTRYLTISAMCGSEKHVYILDKSQPGNIQVLESNFQALGRIDTGIESVHGHKVDMCSVDDTIVISTEYPLGTVKLLKRSEGVVWQADIRNYPALPLQFNPCSVSIIPGDGILFADSYSDKVSNIFMHISNISCLNFKTIVLK